MQSPVIKNRSALIVSRRGRFNSRGSTVLEVAIVGPILVMLVMGCIQFSYFFYVKNLMASAAREGVRTAIIHNKTQTDVNNAAAAIMNAANISPAKYTIVPCAVDPSVASAGQQMTVTITAKWSDIGVASLSSLMGGISGNKQVVATAVMTKEQ